MVKWKRDREEERKYHFVNDDVDQNIYSLISSLNVCLNCVISAKVKECVGQKDDEGRRRFNKGHPTWGHLAHHWHTLNTLYAPPWFPSYSIKAFPKPSAQEHHHIPPRSAIVVVLLHRIEPKRETAKLSTIDFPIA